MSEQAEIFPPVYCVKAWLSPTCSTRTSKVFNYSESGVPVITIDFADLELPVPNTFLAKNAIRQDDMAYPGNLCLILARLYHSRSLGRNSADSACGHEIIRHFYFLEVSRIGHQSTNTSTLDLHLSVAMLNSILDHR